MVVYGRSASAIVPGSLDRSHCTSGALLSSDDFGVERRANGEAHPVMARA